MVNSGNRKERRDTLYRSENNGNGYVTNLENKIDNNLDNNMDYRNENKILNTKIENKTELKNGNKKIAPIILPKFSEKKTEKVNNDSVEKNLVKIGEKNSVSSSAILSIRNNLIFSFLLNFG